MGCQSVSKAIQDPPFDLPTFEQDIRVSGNLDGFTFSSLNLKAIRVRNDGNTKSICMIL